MGGRMAITTIDNNGAPWVICDPTDPGDLQRFLDASSASATGKGFTTRPANPREIGKFTRDFTLHTFNGGEHDHFFGTEA